MENWSDALLLRIFVSSTDKYEHQLLHEYIVFKAKERGLAGATVLKGILGYGASSVIHSYKFWEMGEKVPVVIELVDEESKVRAFSDFILPLLESLRYGCLMTIQPAEVLLYKTGEKTNGRLTTRYFFSQRATPHCSPRHTNTQGVPSYSWILS